MYKQSVTTGGGLLYKHQPFPLKHSLYSAKNRSQLRSLATSSLLWGGGGGMERSTVLSIGALEANCHPSHPLLGMATPTSQLSTLRTGPAVSPFVGFFTPGAIRAPPPVG